jgi:bifunctional UDP-N-acetylglucosamine pyrophosphorylase / glucosamine-1-phosphate N-acetyltransferase
LILSLIGERFRISLPRCVKATVKSMSKKPKVPTMIASPSLKMGSEIKTLATKTLATKTLAIVLAAGEGTRMKSAMPKVLHSVAGRSMVGHVLATVSGSAANAVSVIIGPNRDDVAAEVRRWFPTANVHVQTDRKGTAHAVLHAEMDISVGFDVVVVLFADTPLVQSETISRLCEAVVQGAGVAALGFRAKDPTGYGRFIVNDGALIAIREHKDASDDERQITLCNAGLMALDGRYAVEILKRIGNTNAQKEFYLTDAVEVARSMQLPTTVVEASETEVMGVDDRMRLATAEGLMQQRLREKALRNGATLIDPSSTFLSYDTKIGRDVIVEPHVFFGKNVSIEDNAVIHASCHIEGASIGEGVHVGPFARLRPGTKLAANSRVGNFVEIKNADVDEGAKVSHLSYIGDAHVGAGANIGAGTITCNYDGYFKYQTSIGKNAFIGSNSSLVAPIMIEDGAYVGSGSVITDTVPSGSLALSRGKQVNKTGWATRFHEVMALKKAKKIK